VPHGPTIPVRGFVPPKRFGPTPADLPSTGKHPGIAPFVAAHEGFDIAAVPVLLLNFEYKPYLARRRARILAEPYHCDEKRQDKECHDGLDSISQ
jgi:hypothetical protein